MDTPPHSLVTLARGRRRHLAALLAGADVAVPAPLEVVVADMGCERLATQHVAVRYVEVPVPDPRRLPLAAARNAAVAAASGDVLVLFDVDCVPTPSAAAELARVATERGGLVTAAVHYLPEGSSPGASLAERRATGEPHPAQDALGDGDVPADLFWSTAFAVTREDWDALGGFDETFVGYGAEDTDLGHRAAAVDLPITRCADAVVHHQWHPSPSPPLQHLDAIVENATRFRERWGRWAMEGWLEEFRELGLVEWDPDGSTLRRTDTAAPDSDPTTDRIPA